MSLDMEGFSKHLAVRLAADLDALCKVSADVYRAWKRGKDLTEPMETLRDVLAELDYEVEEGRIVG